MLLVTAFKAMGGMGKNEGYVRKEDLIDTIKNEF